jgi:phosphomannomutase
VTPDELARVRAYIADDPDPRTAAELQGLLDRQDFAALHERFALPLGLGTAGLRGALGAGPARMNRALVARATSALCSLLQQCVPGAARRGLCIGFDARHQSAALAEEVASVAAGAGFIVHLADAPLPTPLLAFAVLDRRAAGGVMITASHNPAADNGYKIYLDNGAQITAPHDAELAERMRAVQSLRALRRMAAEARRMAGFERAIGDELRERYLAAIVGAGRGAVPADHDSGVRIAYTALHGVGEKVAREALARAGFNDVHSVREQADPNPYFPTVAFPNPEEPGALDRVLALAEQVGADLVIANDPDADRLALAARDRVGVMRALSGNEVGALFAEHLLVSRRDARQALVVATIVSSPLIGAVSAAHGARFETTLTGFKWISNRALALEREHKLRCVLGVEEALGYAATDAVRDKDGIAAAVIAAQLVAALQARGETLFDLLDVLHLRHGVHASAQRSLRLPGVGGLERGRALMTALRREPPRQLADLAVTSVRDLLAPTDADDPSALPRSDLLIYELAGGHRIAIRPSGTEPKIKVYLDVREPVSAGEELAVARMRANARLEQLAAAVDALFA